MLTSLSVRIGESPRDKTKLAVPVETILEKAAEAGFRGISVRASAVNTESSYAQVQAFKSALDRVALSASMVTGNLALAQNSAQARDVLTDISPHLELAERLGATLVRVMLHTPEDIQAAQRAADEARERGVTLVQQCHWGSLAETVEQAVELARQVDRDNFGITLEPANLAACGSDYGMRAVQQLAPYLRNVYFQNIRLDGAGPVNFPTRARGDVGVRFVPVAADDGLDVADMLAGLQAVDYQGWFTIHQPLLPGQALDAAIHEAASFLRMHGILA